MSDIAEFENTAVCHMDVVYRVAIALCGSSIEADELVQNTFLSAFERFDSFREGTNCRAWLLRILRNKWIDQIRHRSVVGNVLPIEDDTIAKPQQAEQTTWSNCEDLLENFSDEQVIKALKELPDDQRLTLFLIDVEQLSQQEVAEIMSTVVGTVKSRTSRSRAALKRKLLSYAKEMGFIGRKK